ncbi:MAG TPA: hypothetical protein VGQ73_05385, partial [Gemmatimonadales bacterium]|nr:hypothetical protein [Gemmatimonadales bacterium]
MVSGELMKEMKLLDGITRYRFGMDAEMMAEWKAVRRVPGRGLYPLELGQGDDQPCEGNQRADPEDEHPFDEVGVLAGGLGPELSESFRHLVPDLSELRSHIRPDLTERLGHLGAKLTRLFGHLGAELTRLFGQLGTQFGPD